MADAPPRRAYGLDRGWYYGDDPLFVGIRAQSLDAVIKEHVMPATSAVVAAPASVDGAAIAQSGHVFTRRNLLVVCGCFVVAYLTLVSFQLRIGIDPMG